MTRSRALTCMIAASVALLAVAFSLAHLRSPIGGPSNQAAAAALTDFSFGADGTLPGSHLPGSGSPTISFQGRLANPTTNLPVSDGSYSMTFRIFDSLTGGTSVWNETQTVSVSAGLFTAFLGSAATLDPSVFSGSGRYLEVQVSPDPALSPRLSFAWVPFAFSAEQAGTTSRLGFSAATIYTPSFGEVYRESTSIALGIDGLPIIAFAYSGSLKVVHCGNAACTAGNKVSTVDSSGAGRQSDIAVGTDGMPVIAYYDQTNQDLKFAHCGDLACAAGTSIQIIDAAGSVGESPSITVGSDGLPVMAYFGGAGDDLVVAHCGNPSCSAGNTISTVDPNYAAPDMITVGTDGFPLISYHTGPSSSDVWVAHCGDVACSTAALTLVDSVGSVSESSIAVGADGLPVIAYYENIADELHLARCANLLCSSIQLTQVVDTSADVGRYQSITIGADGFPIVAYFDATEDDLRLLHCGTLVCNVNNSLAIPDSFQSVGSYTDVTVGTDGFPIISYVDGTNGTIKVLHCSDTFCVPNRRPY